MNTIFQLSQYALQELKDSYSIYEIRSLCHIICMDTFGFTNIDIHLRKNEILDESFIKKFCDIIHHLKAGIPIQYILGETEFAGLRISVNASTLIPRPETQELVHWIAPTLSPGERLIDIGTGSGCIAIALARQCPGLWVTAIDLSEEALAVARQNATNNGVEATFLQRDILHYENYSWPVFDIVVSNPPYVRESEKADMESRVLDYEPHSALFVPDDDPLIFYRRIAAFGRQYLKPGGLLYFEINEALGSEMRDMLVKYGYQDIEIKQDIFGKERMIRSIR